MSLHCCQCCWCHPRLYIPSLDQVLKGSRGNCERSRAQDTCANMLESWSQVPTCDHSIFQKALQGLCNAVMSCWTWNLCGWKFSKCCLSCISSSTLAETQAWILDPCMQS
jgi:hypothetical protein